MKASAGFSFSDEGKRKSLPFNPLEYGFDIDVVNSRKCCLKFRKGDYTVDVKKVSGYVFIYKKGEKSHLNKGRTFVTKKETFEKLLNDVVST